MKVLILGAGNMVESILLGLMGKISMEEWCIYSPSGVSAKALATKVGAQAITDLSLIENPEWILVGCKPQQLSSLKETLKGKFKHALYVSLLAAIDEEHQLKTLEIENLIRVMPNLAVKYNAGVSLISSRSAQNQLKRIEEVFRFLGEVMLVSEEELDELTILTGSGPALFYEFTKLLAGSFSSLDAGKREHLARKILAGAAMSSSNESATLDNLIDSVTSKAGVTIAVLQDWRNKSLRDLMFQGIVSGKKRSMEIRENLQN